MERGETGKLRRVRAKAGEEEGIVCSRVGVLRVVEEAVALAA